jgi:hypothetical protein
MAAEAACPEALLDDAGPGALVVVFNCGHAEKNPARVRGAKQFVCSLCGKYRSIDRVILRCHECGRIAFGKRPTRRYCPACYRRNQIEQSRAINQQSLALDGPSKFKRTPGDLMDVVAEALGVSRQRIQQIEARACRIVRSKFRHMEKRRALVYEGFVYLDGDLAIGPRSVTGKDFDDAAAELLLDLWEHCRMNRLGRPGLDRIEMKIFPVTDPFLTHSETDLKAQRG